MALPPRGERLPSEMNEGTDYAYKGHKGPTSGLGALGLLGPSPSAQFYPYDCKQPEDGANKPKHVAVIIVFTINVFYF
jgi:hypothetical protein